jgi:hypothetical protein
MLVLAGLGPVLLDPDHKSVLGIDIDDVELGTFGALLVVGRARQPVAA